MALKVELKPDERIIVGQAIIRNGDQRARFFIEGDAPILREKDILTPKTATSPARLIYLAVQLMYLTQDISQNHKTYFELVHQFLKAAPSSLPIIDDINNRILSGDLYKALKTAKKLIDYESELISHAQGNTGIR
jgi:flagellar biosynthesis repressor protein FlbT